MKEQCSHQSDSHGYGYSSFIIKNTLLAQVDETGGSIRFHYFPKKICAISESIFLADKIATGVN